ncbi:MAG: hypothetical protein M1838_002778 [Thelocarpon superellum]|nr:MAG: hypothetical protein M1838_002778 [Thelocarpon superellum]
MTCVSGVACILGASIICVDYLVRLFPGKKRFRIQDSHVFLSASLSLSFGVMLFSSLYSMLPASKRSLEKGGFSPGAAVWTLTGCFLLGAFGIQVVSRFMHHFIPSHVVDCDHSHDGDGHDGLGDGDGDADDDQDEEVSLVDEDARLNGRVWRDGVLSSGSGASETSPLLSVNGQAMMERPRLSRKSSSFTLGIPTALKSQLSSGVSTIVYGTKPACDERGPCHGYGDKCGTDCLKYKLVKAESNTAEPRQGGRRHLHGPVFDPHPSTVDACSSEEASTSRRPSHRSSRPSSSRTNHHHHHHHLDDIEAHTKTYDPSTSSTTSHSPHHHHVPTNAFLSIGLQTSIAIALHKLPEGFITFATNHANPKLGFAVFMALVVHNVVEGFSMALPLFLALNSRWKAMFWSSLLGGISQPLGAGVAALWLNPAGGADGGMEPSEGVYGAMFAVTAGVMTAVALQLFSESLSLDHHRHLCFTFAFLGMALLGGSFALTEE